MQIKEWSGLEWLVGVSNGQRATWACEAILTFTFPIAMIKQYGLVGMRDVELKDCLALGRGAVLSADDDGAVGLAARQERKCLVND